jgi:hypothetical protein
MRFFVEPQNDALEDTDEQGCGVLESPHPPDGSHYDTITLHLLPWDGALNSRSFLNK